MDNIQEFSLKQKIIKNLKNSHEIKQLKKVVSENSDILDIWDLQNIDIEIDDYCEEQAIQIISRSGLASFEWTDEQLNTIINLIDDLQNDHAKIEKIQESIQDRIIRNEEEIQNEEEIDETDWG